jgi:hypothetical protein
MSTQTLVREDWNNIFKLKFKDAEDHGLIEIKVLESFVGVKPYPVVVVLRTNTGDLIARQYTIEGKAEKMVDDFDIVKIEEPEPISYEEIVKELMIKGVFVSRHKRNWSRIEGCNLLTSEFYLSGHWIVMHTINDFFFSFDLENFFDFDTYLTLRGKS